MKYILFRKSLIFGVIIMFLGAGIIPNTVKELGASDDGLVGYWSFDEGSGATAYDISGYGNHGIIYGATWVEGISGKALYFDGQDDYVEVPNSPSLNPTNEISLEAWYKTISFKGDGNNAIIDKGYGTHTEPYYQYHLGVCGDLYDAGYSRFIFDITPGGYSDWICPRTPDGFWMVGDWYHIVGTYDGSVAKLFVNGDLIDSKTMSGSMVNYGQNVVFGSFSDIETMWGEGHDYTPGTIDEIRIYNRALTANEIQTHYEEYMPSDGLVGYWNFDESGGTIAHDLSGNNNHGVIRDATWTSGISGTALSLDGINDWVEVFDSPSLNPTNAITLEAWYKPTISWIGHGNDPIIDKGYGVHQEPYFQYHLGVRGDLYPNAVTPLDFEFDVAAGGVSNWLHCGESNYFSFENWYHVVGTYDGGTMKLYVNGNSIDSKTVSGTIQNYGTNVYFGKYTYPHADHYLPGVIDEIRIYNRALTASEVQAHYQQHMPSDGLVGYWNFDEGSGATAYDSSGNNNHGTIHGATWIDGIAGNALYFDGVNDYVRVPDSASLDITHALTITAWINASSFFGEGWHNGNPIVAKWQEGAIGQYWLPAYTNGNIRFGIADGVSTEYLDANNVLTTQKWYFVVAWWDGSHTRLYLNGALIAEDTTSITTLYQGDYTEDYLQIGHDTGGDHPWWYFHGIIDEVRIYNRALTESEIKEHYEEYMPSDGLVEKKALLIGCWDYPDDKKDLDSPKRNIPNMERLLELGFDFNDVYVLYPKRSNTVNNSIHNFKRDVDDDDIKFFYYNGHGDQIKFTQKSDGSLLGVNEALNISGDRYYDYYLSSRFYDANNFCAVFDTCFSGGFSHEFDDTEDYHKSIGGLNGIAGDSKLIGMATNSTEKGWESPWGLSYFTEFLMEAFTFNRDYVKTLIPGDDTRVSMEEALLYAKDSVENLIWWWARTHPKIYDGWPEKIYNVDQFYLSDKPINDFWSAKSSCPVHLHVYDEAYNHVGLNETGDYESEIEGILYSGTYGDENEMIVVFTPVENNNIKIVAEAYGDGNFSLECKDYTNGNKNTTILYKNISIVNGTIAYINVQNNIFSDAEIDENGDGISDRIISPIVVSIGESDGKTEITPGFEIVFAVIAMILVFFLKKHWKKQGR